METTRREFLSTSVAAATAAAAAGVLRAADRPTRDDISLAAWSINRSFFVAKKWKLLDLPKIVRQEFNINGIELVNQFFENPMQRYLQELKKNANANGITFVLVMVDGEGDMSAKDKSERMQAAVCHRKWIDIGHFLGCHAIRCNLGGGRGDDWKQDKDLVSRAAESFNNLLEYAKQADMNVVIENHGGASSNADVVVSLMKAVNNPNFGTLPDFGNVNEGDNNADVLRKIVPYAKGISVKASWNTDETHTGWDLDNMLKICRDSGYHGFYGIESSYPRMGRRTPGEAPPQLPPEQIWENELKGVKLTKAVLDRFLART
jgi:L-ribulose-5-phosphate 3-epimerase